MKKSILLCIFILWITCISSAFGACSYNGWDIASSLDNCLSDTDVVQSSNFKAEEGFKAKINSWTRGIASVLWLFAVGSIVYGALLMTLSAGEDEKIKKGKDIVKWSILGFLWVVLAGGLIAIVVNFIFAVG